MSNIPPEFLLADPAPQIKQRLYHDRRLVVWEGKVKISSINGWVDNPRIDLSKKIFKSRVGNREITQDEIFDLMKNDPEIRLKELRDDILKNGLRNPLTLGYGGKLLDGNRRFFALKYALEEMAKTDPNRHDLESVEAYVLISETKEDEQLVLVEENFSASLKIEWPDYVKAKRIVDADADGLTADEISKKFGWAKGKIKETLRIYGIIEDFIAYATSEKDLDDETGGGLGLSDNDAESIAAKNYQYFNEAQKSFYEAIKTDFQFKIQFFRWIAEGKFKSFPEVRVAYEAWNSPEAKAALQQPDPSAAKSAKAIIDYHSRVGRSTADAVGKIDLFVTFLKDMKAAEIKKIPVDTLVKLEEALDLVTKMSRAAQQTNES